MRALTSQEARRASLCIKPVLYLMSLPSATLSPLFCALCNLHRLAVSDPSKKLLPYSMYGKTIHLNQNHSMDLLYRMMQKACTCVQKAISCFGHGLGQDSDLHFT